MNYSVNTLTDSSVNPSTSNFNFVKVFQNPGCTRELKGAYCIAMDCASAMFCVQYVALSHFVTGNMINFIINCKWLW